MPTSGTCPALQRELTQLFALTDDDFAKVQWDAVNADELKDALWALVTGKYTEKENIVPREILTRVERDLMLQIVDQQWKDHLYSLDHLKEGIGLRGYGQRDPLVEYKKESFQLFQDMRRRIEEEIVRYLWWLKPVVQTDGEEAAVPAPPVRQAPRRQALSYNNPAAGDAVRVPVDAQRRAAGAGGRHHRRHAAPGARRRRRCPGQDGEARRAEDRPQRSVLVRLGKKYKKCHGAT